MGKVETLFGEVDEPEPQRPIDRSEEGYYLLDEERHPVPVSAKLWERNPKEGWTVAHAELFDGAVIVTTEFTGTDHDENEREQGQPLMFETSVLDDELIVEAVCATWAEAEAGHAKIVANVTERSNGRFEGAMSPGNV